MLVHSHIHSDDNRRKRWRFFLVFGSHINRDYMAPYNLPTCIRYLMSIYKEMHFPHSGKTTHTHVNLLNSFYREPFLLNCFKRRPCTPFLLYIAAETPLPGAGKLLAISSEFQSTSYAEASCFILVHKLKIDRKHTTRAGCWERFTWTSFELRHYDVTRQCGPFFSLGPGPRHDISGLTSSRTAAT